MLMIFVGTKSLILRKPCPFYDLAQKPELKAYSILEGCRLPILLRKPWADQELPCISPHQFGLAQDVAVHGSQQILFAGSGT